MGSSGITRDFFFFFFLKKKVSAYSKHNGGVFGRNQGQAFVRAGVHGIDWTREVLQLEYDDKTKFEDLVTFFFQIHDPTTPNQSGNDRGTQYRSAIFYHTPEQKEIAERIRDEVKNNPKAMKSFHNKEIITEITAATTFYPAEDYHQKYLDKNPNGYCNHRPLWK